VIDIRRYWWYNRCVEGDTDMNMFVLDSDLEKCASYYVNKHQKIILEIAQMLCAAHHMTGNRSVPYRLTHKNHPCSVWVRESLANYYWAVDLATALNTEFRWRMDKDKNHKSFDVIISLPKPRIMNRGMTPFVQAMPDKYKSDDPIEAYRNYYRNDKQHLADWGKRSIPEWW